MPISVVARQTDIPLDCAADRYWSADARASRFVPRGFRGVHEMDDRIKSAWMLEGGGRGEDARRGCVRPAISRLITTVDTLSAEIYVAPGNSRHKLRDGGAPGAARAPARPSGTRAAEIRRIPFCPIRSRRHARAPIQHSPTQAMSPDGCNTAVRIRHPTSLYLPATTHGRALPAARRRFRTETAHHGRRRAAAASTTAASAPPGRASSMAPARETARAPAPHAPPAPETEPRPPVPFSRRSALPDLYAVAVLHDLACS